MSKASEKRLDKATVKRFAEFLVGKEGLNVDQYMDMRTDIRGKKAFQGLLFFRMLDEYFGSKAAKIAANAIERLSISTNRGGRTEGVTVLLGNLPKEVILRSGYEGPGDGALEKGKE